MLTAKTLHPQDLTAAQSAAWRALAAAEPAFYSPLLGPDFAQAVGAVRQDARVAVLSRNGDPVGFLPYHQRPGGFARPIGSPLSDYQALIVRRDLAVDGADALTALGLSAFRFNGLVDPFAAFTGAVEAEKPAYVVDLDRPVAAYLEEVRAASPKRFKNFRRLASKLDREIGETTIVAPDRSQDAFDTLLQWKREQFHRTGGHDVLRPEWTRQLLQSLFEQRAGAFRGLMITLYAGDRLVAGHFGVRLNGVYHPWIASADPELAAYSPGQTFLWKAIEAMPDLGLTRYDLGPSHDHYKRHYGLSQVTVGEGLATAHTAAGRAAGAREKVWTLAGARHGTFAGRLRGRLDAIAAVELSAAGRVRSLAEAFAAQTRRRTVEEV
jgi:CelD/BcsL family acetyltransferase involved in cellulose biosynthesis